MYSHVPFLCKKVRHVWRGGNPTKDFPTPRRLTFFSEPIPRRNSPFLMASFFSTPEMASSKTTSQAPRRRSPGPSQSSTKRSPGHQPSQLGGHSSRVTSSWSLTRKNHGGELNTMQGCKARTPKVFKSLTLQSHQSYKC